MARGRSDGAEPGPPAPLLHAFGAVSEWLDATVAPGAVIGGVAASILGRPRLTEAIDVLVLLEPEDWPGFLAAGRPLGFAPRMDDALGFARSSRVLFVSHQPSGTRINVVLGAMPLEEEIVHGAAKVEVAGVAIPLPSPESIVLMKAIAQRARDVADIEGIVEVHDHLDLDWVRSRLAEFDQALGRSDLLDEFDRVLTRIRRPTPFGGPSG